MLDISNVYTKMKEKCRSVAEGKDERKGTKESNGAWTRLMNRSVFVSDRSNLFLRLSARDAVPLIM